MGSSIGGGSIGGGGIGRGGIGRDDCSSLRVGEYCQQVGRCSPKTV